jgi:hypothetical protein
MSNSIVKIKHVSGLNCNPHADLWVHKDQGSSLLSLIRERTKIHMKDWGSLHSNARRYFEGLPLSHETTQDGEESPQTPRDEGRFFESD